MFILIDDRILEAVSIQVSVKHISLIVILEVKFKGYGDI